MCLAIPGELIEIEGAEPLTRLGRVRYGEIVKQASLAFVPEAQPGDYLLVHAGVAISILDPEQAARTFAALEQLP